ncbi:hypothetical protein C7S20_02560 [Christiangramia fulva]|uniref:DUF4402 domain-containing protein n=1 Tax=Christiangramia fulva TaxID=2126553 RepID=A0A2R3Z1W3_9FLAO|nr:DUF4402 domain-containing protein [Christiangramia fulva]AVR44232.1 hypothetical protein C7S20_02560 [Christiangramia fulva]
MKMLFLFFLLLQVSAVSAQNIFISVTQELNFGDFYLLNSSQNATIRVAPTGEWSNTGNATQINPNHSPAIFSISTDSTTPIMVQVHTTPGVMTNSEGLQVELLSEETNTVYTLQKDHSLEIPIGGILKIHNGEALNGTFSGNLSLWATIINE